MPASAVKNIAPLERRNQPRLSRKAISQQHLLGVSLVPVCSLAVLRHYIESPLSTVVNTTSVQNSNSNCRKFGRNKESLSRKGKRVNLPITLRDCGIIDMLAFYTYNESTSDIAIDCLVYFPKPFLAPPKPPAALVSLFFLPPCLFTAARSLLGVVSFGACWL